MKHRKQCYEAVVAIFEKYGFNVVTCADQRTITLSGLSGKRGSVPRTTVELIAQREGIDVYVADIEPIRVAGWRITLW